MYMSFFETAEKKRRWSVYEDIPWDRLDPSVYDEGRAMNVETFCGVELYLPDYLGQGVNLVRENFGRAWFQANWGYEESKHGLALRMYLLKTGLRTEEQLRGLEDAIAARPWRLPWDTPRRMTCYGAIQEASTLLAYARQLEDAQAGKDEVLATIYRLIARDEAAHQQFYRAVLKLELEEHRHETLEDLALVSVGFRMPAIDLLPDSERRVETLRMHNSFNRWGFFLKVWMPLLKLLGVSRQEFGEYQRRALDQIRDQAS
ncbi:acyl-ACP desaturase [Cystobacter ferrugineus]|uniref:Acyl-ACP desaturase n=2 Tax=Cystobacter ferrugineus TaxID=83449 RepID=A0A1L9AY60_9BACT|nr:acyl-ACP desaturase [Cystobacter ferrugineus]